MDERLLKLRWPTTCAGCTTALPGGSKAWWDSKRKEAKCPSCHGNAGDTAAPLVAPIERHRSKLLHLGIGRRYAGTRVMLLVADRYVPVINDDGELLAEFSIDPTKTYQTQKRPGQHA